MGEHAQALGGEPDVLRLGSGGRSVGSCAAILCIIPLHTSFAQDYARMPLSGLRRSGDVSGGPADDLGRSAAARNIDEVVQRASANPATHAGEGRRGPSPAAYGITSDSKGRPIAHVHPEARRGHSHVARHRRDRRRAGPSREPGRDPAAGQAQAASSRRTSTPVTSSSSSTPTRSPSPATSWSRRRPTATPAYPGGLRCTSYAELLEKNPEKAVEKAIRGMLPKNSLGRQKLTQAQGLPGAEHPHPAQQPVPFEITQVAQ